MRFVVTGGLGFIGGAVVQRLIKDGHKVFIIDNMYDCTTHSTGWPTSVVSTIDVADIMALTYSEVHSALGGDVDGFFHFAAHYANIRSIEEPIVNVRTNCVGTVAALEWCRVHGIRRFVFASSSISAGGAPEVLTPYGITKYTGELLCQCYAERFGMQITSPRFFNVYGCGDSPGKYRAVIPNFFKLALNGKTLRITGKEQARDFTYVNDVVAGIMAGFNWITGRDAFLCYNIAKGYSDKLTDVAKFIIKLTGSSSALEVLPDRDWDAVHDRVGDVSKFKLWFPKVYKNMHTLQSGLPEAYDKWYKHACI